MCSFWSKTYPHPLLTKMKIAIPVARNLYWQISVGYKLVIGVIVNAKKPWNKKTTATVPYMPDVFVLSPYSVWGQ